jgi:adenylate kinase family enzyme
MRQIHLVFIEPSLPSVAIEEHLSNSLNMPFVSIGDSFREQFKTMDDLTLKIQNCMNQGRLPDTHLTTELIRRQIQNRAFPNFLLPHYPKTFEQYEQLLDMLKDNNYGIEKIWYFKHSDSLDYFQNYYENSCKDPEKKGWFDKFGDDMEEGWFEGIDTYSKEIAELYDISNPLKWRIIEVAYSERLTFLSKIDDSLKNSTPSV